MRAAFLVLLIAARAGAEPVDELVHDGHSDRAITTTLGLDGALAANLGAAAGIAHAGDRLALVAYGDATIALGGADLDDFRARIGARVTLLRHGPLFVHGSLAGVVRATKNTGFQAQALATELAVQPGVALGRFRLALDLALEQAWATHVAPTPAYRELVDAMATGGWYETTARQLRAGATAAVELGRVEIAARAGYAYSGSLDYLPPLYVVVDGGYRF